jgi:cell division protein FtsI/penicillin-binding protein 2
VRSEDAVMPETPEEPVDGDDVPVAPAFEAPHRNGAVHHDEGGRPKRKHAPWEFLILTLFVLILCIGIILGWTLVGSKSPEKLDAQTAAQVSAACDTAVAKLKALPDPDPRGNGTERAGRVRAENAPLRQMVAEIAAVHPKSSTQAKGLEGWTKDWSRMIDARVTYADALEALAHSSNPNGRVRFIYPASNAITPVTSNMDDYVRESTPRLNSCFTTALQLEIVEGPRVYEKVTS